MYIAIHPLATLPPTLADQENILLAAALNVPLSRIVAHNELPWFTSTDQPAQGMALLSILAHELGHLLLAQTNADGTGDANHTHPRSLLCDKPGNRGASSNTCFDTNFVPPNAGSTLWNPTVFYPGMRRWITFGDRNGNKYQDATRDLDTIRGLVNTNPSAANAAINTLLTEFVSVFAAVSPEEDVVETYKYKILADVAKASNLTLHFPAGGPPSVLVLNNVPPAGSNLQRKANCVNSLPQ
jgi:hypothetical protein